jgi:radical SAM superfamily enzyme YgiQ (UPF0313 family)
VRICLATQHADADFAPLALLYVKASLIDQVQVCGEDVAILEFADAIAPDDIAERILALEPDVLGLSCYLWNIEALMAACRRIKVRRPQARIVLGGPEVGPVAASVLDANRVVDVVVRSEGERPFAAIVSACMRGGDVGGVAGIRYRDADGIHENRTRRSSRI